MRSRCENSIELNFNARYAIEHGHFCCSSICCHIRVRELLIAIPENRLLWCYMLQTTKQSFNLFTHRPALQLHCAFKTLWFYVCCFQRHCYTFKMLAMMLVYVYMIVARYKGPPSKTLLLMRQKRQPDCEGSDDDNRDGDWVPPSSADGNILRFLLQSASSSLCGYVPSTGHSHFKNSVVASKCLQSRTVCLVSW